MKNLIHRIRKGLAGLVVAGASLSAHLMAEEPKYGLAKILQEQGIEFVDKTNVRTYDANIPGAKTVEEYPVDGAPYKLIHVRQAHVNGVISEQYLRDLHENIYKTLDYLVDKEKVKEVYCEGVVKETEENENKGAKEMADLVNNQRIRDRILGTGASARLLAMEGRIKIKAAEREETYYKAVEQAEIGKTADYDKIVLEDREDALLDILKSEENKNTFVVLYGGGHNWLNNVQEWNERNPDKRFSLITITPKLFDGYSDNETNARYENHRTNP